MSRRIDLNADVGEGAGQDEALMACITSANVACGAHAGDAATFRATARGALARGVAIGAHPGFADREHFGRRELPISPAEAGALVRAQLAWAEREAHAVGAVLRHVKLHGALYNMAARDPALGEAVVTALAAAAPGLTLVALAGSGLVAIGRARGLVVAEEAFADRGYQSDGTLTPRAHPRALLSDPMAILAQALRLVQEGRVEAVDGTSVRVAADTLCLHGDGASAAASARALRAGLEGAGIQLAPLAGPLP